MKYVFEHPEVTCCQECPCVNSDLERYTHRWCQITNEDLNGDEYKSSDYFVNKPDWCPLQKVSE